MANVRSPFKRPGSLRVRLPSLKTRRDKATRSQGLVRASGEGKGRAAEQWNGEERENFFGAPSSSSSSSVAAAAAFDAWIILRTPPASARRRPSHAST